MKLSDQGAAFIAAHEGFVPRWYLCPANVGTIGHGLTWGSKAFQQWWRVNKPGRTFGPGATITRDESIEAKAFVADAEYGRAVNDALNGQAIPQHAFDAAVSATFNMGPVSINWKWGQALARGDIGVAARLLATTGTTAKGSRKRLPGLVRRRAEESALMRHGDYAGAKAAQPRNDTGALSKGSRGGRVMAMQRHLQRMGLYDGRLDGIFGSGTEAAVMAFERQIGRVPDGVADAALIEAMEDATPGAAPPEAGFTPVAAGGRDRDRGGMIAALLATLAAASAAAGAWLANLPCQWLAVFCN